MNTIQRLAIAIAWLAAAVSTQAAATYYVETNGLDSRVGTGGWGDALLTISNAVKNADPGDTVLVSNGTYTVTREILVSNAIVLTSLNGYAVTVIDGNARNTTNRCLVISNAAAVVDGFTISNGYLATNVDTSLGGGVLMYGGELRNSVVGWSMGHSGAGIYVASGTVFRCVVSNNYGTFSGGGVYLTAGGVLRESTVAENTNALTGGGLTAATGSEVTRCLVVSNWATTAGGIHASVSTLTSNEVYGNSGFYGGGAYLLGTTMRFCTMAHNTSRSPERSNAGTGGGGVNARTFAVVEDCLISNNWAGAGGGLLLASTSTARRCTIAQNVGGGSYAGGGVYIHNYGVADACLIAANSATNGTGGGIMCWNYGGDVRNSLITRNVCSNNGGGVYFYRTGFNIENCSIISNYSGNQGGGVYFGASNNDYYLTGRVNNTIIYLNSAGQATYSNVCYHSQNKPPWQTVSNSCLAPTPVIAYGLNNTAANPGFVSADPANPDYRLAPGSPCINKGLIDEWMLDAVDYDGRPRIDRLIGVPDMGAYEYLFGGGLFLVR